MFKKLSPLVFLTCFACVPSPKQNYTLEQLKEVDSLEELMRVNAKMFDPISKLQEASSIPESDYADLTHRASQLVGSSDTLRIKIAPKYATGFLSYSEAFNSEAKKFEAAVGSRDVAGIRDALKGMKTACASCHKEFK